MRPSLTDLQIRYQPWSALQPNPHNSRTHSKRQIRQIADSMKAFGFTNPILLDESNTIIAGHGRVEAAKLLGLAQVPTIRLENLSPEQIRAYVIADNRLAEKAGWDKAILAIELQHLLTIDSEFDVTVTGFEIPEIDLLLLPGDERPIQMTCSKSRNWRSRSPEQEICGSSADTRSLAEARSNRIRMRDCSARSGPRSCLSILPTTCPSPEMLVVRAPSNTASSPWRRAR
jgi:ParB-like chromosome segregation protein Spo0J